MTGKDRARASGALLITGTVGAGKTTTAYAIGEVLRTRNVPHAIIDMDALSEAWPAPEDDRFNSRVAFANLSAVSRNFVRAGAACLVIAAVIEDLAARSRYEQATQMPVTICRLRVGLETVRTRLTARHEPGPGRDWHLERSGELEMVLDAAEVGDATIDVVDETPDEVARLVLAALRVADRPPA